MRILLVEDNPDHQEQMSLALTEYDPTWWVEIVTSCDEALRSLRDKEAYDLVFLDHNLPGRNGLEVLEALRQVEAPPQVVMVTGHGDEQVAVAAMKGGAYDYVVKGADYLHRLPVVAQRAMEAHQLAAERKQAEEQIKASLREKEVLLQEIHHRVKNNLAVVFNLLEWQAEMIEEQPARAAFQDSQNRLQTMARIHEHLYRSHDLSRVKMAEFVEELKDYLCQSYGTSDITFKVDLNDVALEVNTAIPLGLIINELVSNSLKHAFPRDGQKPAALVNEVCITLGSNNGELELTIRDNGVGLPIDLDLESVKSLGLSLVHMLSKQLRGRLEVDRVEGTTFRLTFAAPERRSLDDGK